MLSRSRIRDLSRQQPGKQGPCGLPWEFCKTIIGAIVGSAVGVIAIGLLATALYLDEIKTFSTLIPTQNGLTSHKMKLRWNKITHAQVANVSLNEDGIEKMVAEYDEKHTSYIKQMVDNWQGGEYVCEGNTIPAEEVSTPETREEDSIVPVDETHDSSASSKETSCAPKIKQEGHEQMEKIGLHQIHPGHSSLHGSESSKSKCSHDSKDDGHSTITQKQSAEEAQILQGEETRLRCPNNQTHKIELRKKAVKFLKTCDYCKEALPHYFREDEDPVYFCDKCQGSTSKFWHEECLRKIQMSLKPQAADKVEEDSKVDDSGKRRLLSSKVAGESNTDWIKRSLTEKQIRIVNEMGSEKKHTKSSPSSMLIKGRCWFILCLSAIAFAVIGLIGGATNKLRKLFGTFYIVSAAVTIAALVIAFTIKCEYEPFKVSDKSFGISMMLTAGSAVSNIIASCVLCFV